MNMLDTVVLGLVEGGTEFLPVSSTGHLLLTSKLLSLPSTEYLKTFDISIQLGAILSVVVLYWQKFILNRKILSRVCVAFVPTAVMGLVLYKMIKHILMENIQVVLWSLLIGGVIIIVFEFFYHERKDAVRELEKISYPKAFMVGLFQSLAMVPGVSRSAATILGGLAIGIKRTVIVEFSFLLAAPTMLAATGLDLIKHAHEFSVSQFKLLLVGFIVSFVVAIFSIKFLLHFIKQHNFTWFGVYRIVVAVIFLFI